MSSAESIIVELGRHQHELVTRPQLLAAGISDKVIRRCRNNGFLDHVAEGLYRLAGAPDTLQGQLRAIQLLVPGAAAYRESAARLLVLPGGGWSAAPEVVAPRNTTNRCLGVALHQTAHLPEADLTVVDGLRATTAERTLCDLASVLGFRRLEWLCQRAIVGGTTTAEELLACFFAFARRGRKGSALMRVVLDGLLSGPGFANTELEQLFLELVRAHHLPPFEYQWRPPWYDGRRGIADFCRQPERVLVEVDGRAWHTIQQAIEEDRRRDRLAHRHGYLPLRFGWAECRHRPEEVATEVRHHLVERRPEAA
jgi:very-short-patch-repair endonuclease